MQASFWTKMNSFVFLNNNVRETVKQVAFKIEQFTESLINRLLNVLFQ